LKREGIKIGRRTKVRERRMKGMKMVKKKKRLEDRGKRESRKVWCEGRRAVVFVIEGRKEKG